MKRFLFVVLVLFLMTSCGSLFKFATYDVSLSSVESPVDSNVKFGETKIVNVEEEGQSKYQYEDDFIQINWYVGRTQFYFDLTNKSGYSIKIPWDDIVYVNESGKSMRVMHAGVKYTDRNASQPASVLPKNAMISDILLPTANVYFSNYGGWMENPLFPNYQDQESANNSPVLGKSVQVVFPILIQDVTNEYIFVFNIDGVTVK